MLKLIVAVVGYERITSVSINGDDLVVDLREVIVSKLQYPLSMALDIKLFCTKRSDEWLATESTSFTDLQRPTFPTDSLYLAPEQEMQSLCPVSDYYAPDIPSCDVVHVLVKLPTVKATGVTTTEGLSIFRDPVPSVPWVPEPKPCPQLRFDSSRFLCIPSHYLRNSGLEGSEQDHDLYLYRRQALEEQWNEIERDSVDAEAVLWISGYPGSGKSCAVYAFVCGVVDRSRWNVLWIQYDEVYEVFHCVKFEGDAKSTCTLSAKSVSTEDLLGSCGIDRDLFVVLDGYTDIQAKSCHDVKTDLYCWQSDNSHHRRLVYTTVMVWLGEEYDLSDCKDLETLTKPSRQNGSGLLLDTMEFTLSSWTLDEYLVAVEHDGLFHSVMEEFEVKTDPGIDGRQKLVRDKYHVAGGNAFSMFRLTTDKARANVGYVLDGGEASSGDAAWLKANYDVGQEDRAEFRSFIASADASIQIGLKIGPVRLLERAQWIDGYRSEDCHLFPAWVIASLERTGFEYRPQDSPKDPSKWNQRPIMSFDPTEESITDVDYYFLPTKWRHGGYDVVYVVPDEATRRLRYVFLQIIPSTTHNFDPEPFVDMLNMLDEEERVIAVELWIVVPLSMLEGFSTSAIDGESFRRSLADAVFTESSFGDEIESLIRVVGVDCRSVCS